MRGIGELGRANLGIFTFFVQATTGSFEHRIARKRYENRVQQCVERSQKQLFQGGKKMHYVWLKQRLKKGVLTVSTAMALYILCLSPAHAVFINEIHYDNAGSDVGEGVELAGAAGQDLSGWSLLFYNGGNGAVYKTHALTGVFTDMQYGMGVLGFSISGIQNGSADGLALVDASNSVLQFLSYEGSLTASSGAAMGMTSTDIGVAESGATLAGSSLQLLGSGRDSADFTWGTAAESFSGINSQQRFFVPVRQVSSAVPEPASGLLLLLGLPMLAFRRRVKNAVGLTLPA